MENKNNPAVPEQTQGKSVDLEESLEVNSIDEAKELFQVARTRLLHPSKWHELAGNLSAFFKTDEKSSVKEIKENDHLAIDLPAPKSSAGDGHDWVRVQSIIPDADPDADESLAVTLETSVNPHQAEEGVAHFFNEGATSSFILKRRGNKLTASYHGRNEIP